MIKTSTASFSPDATVRFVQSLYDKDRGAFASVPNGPVTLYGTCYAVLTLRYLNKPILDPSRAIDFIRSTQERATGLFIGPELRSWQPTSGAMHDLDHLRMHLTCTALPVLQEFEYLPTYRLAFAERFLDETYLRQWLVDRPLHNAWFEGNNILFVGQLLAYLRDTAGHPKADAALKIWFSWLDEQADPRTGLWGTNHGCSVDHAIFGGYHQLLLYYYEEQSVKYPERLIDSVLSIQHPDGGFSSSGGGGACEDVDAVDILVNIYKRVVYRRADIRVALRRCLRHLLALQNPDGGFPYTRRKVVTDHMSIPGTGTTPGGSGAFPTWFRVHTLALIAEILTDEISLQSVDWRFSRAISMGWHRPWSREQHSINDDDRLAEELVTRTLIRRVYLRHIRNYLRRMAGLTLRRIRATTLIGRG